MILYRHFIKENFIGLVSIFTVMVAIVLTNQFSTYLDQAASGAVTLFVVCKLMLLQLIILFFYILPQSFYFSSLYLLVRKYMDNEMMVLFACGVSYRKIFNMIFSFALVLAALSFWLMFYVDPLAENAEGVIRHSAYASMTVEKLIPGQFTAIGDGNVIYPGEVRRFSSEITGGVTLMQKTGVDQLGNQKWNIINASSAYQQPYLDSLMPFLVFHDGVSYSVAAGSANAVTMTFTDYGIKIPGTARVASIWPLDASLSELWHAKSHDIKAASMFQWRLAMPLSILILSLWVIPLSHTKPRQGRMLVFIPAVLLYLVYFDLLYMMRGWIAHGTVPASWGMWSVHGGALLLAVIMWALRFEFWRTWFTRRLS